MNEYFSGKKLYGNDFDINQIKKWFEDEKEGYSGLISGDEYTYDFHAVNMIHGYNKIKHVNKFDKVLSFGGAKGEEIRPILNKTGDILIIEPSKKLRVKEIDGKKVKYIEPNASGKINLPDKSIDLITVFSVLHHIPNVEFVFGELIRVLKTGGFIIIREPIVSMGDWTKPRKGLTKRERGIPLNFFREIIKKKDMKIISERKILFPIVRRINIGRMTGGNSNFFVGIDYILSRLFSWNDRYHSTRFWHKIRPQSVSYVLKKDDY